MNKRPKCEYCYKPLTLDDSVFIRVTRYDLFGRHIKKKAFCTNCWNHTTIFVYGVGGKHE